MSTLGHPNVMASFFADEQPDPSAQAISQRWWTSAFCAGDPATAQRRSLEPLRTRWIPIDWNIGKVDIWGDWAERSTTGETSFLFFLGYIYICICIYIYTYQGNRVKHISRWARVGVSVRDCSMSQKLSVKVRLLFVSNRQHMGVSQVGVTPNHPSHHRVATDIDHTLRSAPDVSMCFFTDEWGRNGLYPLVNCYITMENHHFQWENPLFLWPFSIAMLNYQRVSGAMKIRLA